MTLSHEKQPFFCKKDKVSIGTLLPLSGPLVSLIADVQSQFGPKLSWRLIMKYTEQKKKLQFSDHNAGLCVLLTETN